MPAIKYKVELTPSQRSDLIEVSPIPGSVSIWLPTCRTGH